MIASLMPDIMGILAMSVTNSVETSSTIGYTQMDRYGHVLCIVVAVYEEEKRPETLTKGVR